jgi:hypothetical protein
MLDLNRRFWPPYQKPRPRIFGDIRDLVAKTEHFVPHYNWQGHHLL